MMVKLVKGMVIIGLSLVMVHGILHMVHQDREKWQEMICHDDCTDRELTLQQVSKEQKSYFGSALRWIKDSETPVIPPCVKKLFGRWENYVCDAQSETT